MGNGAVAWRVVQCRTLIDLGYHKARRRSLFARSSCSDELLSALSTHSHSFILLDMTTVPALITGRPTPYPSVRWLGTAMMRPRRVSWRSERSRRLHRTWYARPIPTPDTRDSQIEITQFLPTTIKSISTHHPSFSLSIRSTHRRRQAPHGKACASSHTRYARARRHRPRSPWRKCSMHAPRPSTGSDQRCEAPPSRT